MVNNQTCHSVCYEFAHTDGKNQVSQTS